jgi:antitoxin MazE
MVTKAKKWGNSLAMRFPAALVNQFKLLDGTNIRLVVKKNKIEIIPEKSPELTLDDLLAGVTPENIHGETEWGTPVGKEII